MAQKHLHRVHQVLRPITPWLFLIPFAVFLFISITALRDNNLKMLQLKDTVLKADEESKDVEVPLRNLREFVYSHMNTNLSSGTNAIKPPIQLKFRYERLVQAEKDRVAAINDKTYTEATAFCVHSLPKGEIDEGRATCVQQYINDHGIKEQPIPDDLYKFDFVSPFWSPDLAGWSMLAASLFLLLFIIRLALGWWHKHHFEE